MDIPGVEDSLAQQRSSRRMEQRRRQICDVAVRLCAEHGYQATTLSLIAEELGYTKTNVYHYVQSKEEVFAQVVERFMQQQLLEVVGIPASLPPAERLRRVLVTHITGVCTRPEGKVALAVDLAVRQKLKESPQARAAAIGYKEFMGSLIREGAEAGVFQVSDVSMAALSVLGVLNSVPRWYLPQGRFTPDQIAHHLTEFIFSGLRYAYPEQA